MHTHSYDKFPDTHTLKHTLGFCEDMILILYKLSIIPLTWNAHTCAMHTHTLVPHFP